MIHIKQKKNMEQKKDQKCIMYPFTILSHLQIHSFHIVQTFIANGNFHIMNFF